MNVAPTPRIPVVEGARGPVGAQDVYAGYDQRIGATIQRGDLRHAAEAARELDPITLDLVRIRTAQLDGCHHCQSVRDSVAMREGLQESTVGKVRDYEHSDLSEKHKVALRLVDAFILGFGHVPDDLKRAARAHFTEAELLDIAGKVFYSTSNKIRVAMAIDDPENIEQEVGLRTYDYPVAPGYVARTLEAAGAGRP